MTQEEKARAYDNAMNIAKQMINDLRKGKDILAVSELETMFPELKESEDEQHRKWILEYLYDGLQKSDEQFKSQFKCAIAWLEKQGEKKEISITIPDNLVGTDMDGGVIGEKGEEGMKPQVDGFDAELNALLKKYEHLPKEEILGCLNFYILVLGKEMEEQK